MTDDDIRTAIQNGSGVKAALFVPEVSFEALVRRQISCLLDPSLQCSRFIYDELMKINHKCMVNEVQRFPVLRKPMDEVLGNFLGEGLEWSEAMIRHIIDMMLWSLIRHHHLLKKSQQTSHLLNRFKPWSKLLYITFEGATRCHTLGGQLGAWGGAKGAGAGLQGAEGGSGAPLEVDALVRQGNMTVFVNVASHFSTGAYGFWSGRWSYQDRILPNRVF